VTLVVNPESRRRNHHAVDDGHELGDSWPSASMASVRPTSECDERPLRLSSAITALARCIAATAALLARHDIRQPTGHVGDVLTFADGTSARVYRETVSTRTKVTDPAALAVEFRLRWIRGRGHRLFRAESLLNTPLFVGFPGFVSKLWLTHDQRGCYRGLYEWDGPARAHAYARALWWVLALVSDRSSIHYAVLPGCTRAELLAGIDADGPSWWRVVPALEHR
jgi:hypothetical protein